jgi:hypothetical protein
LWTARDGSVSVSDTVVAALSRDEAGSRLHGLPPSGGRQVESA